MANFQKKKQKKHQKGNAESIKNKNHEERKKLPKNL